MAEKQQAQAKLEQDLEASQELLREQQDPHAKERLKKLADELEGLKAQSAVLKAHWQREKAVITKISDVTAISSQVSRNVVTLAASGTSSIAAQNPGSTAIAVRELAPCPSRPAYPVV